ncbi:Uncharacterised protein [Mycobacteroides abscessus subsp. abscessus]|nr:Uncharacterised protein [Mycobacteroides abscessus subsp. abscessus]
MTSTMRKTNASATAANSKKSSLTYPRNSAVPVPNPVRLTELPARVPSLVELIGDGAELRDGGAHVLDRIHRPRE